MTASKKPPTKRNAYPFWSPRFWHGMRWGDWWRLVARHRCQIHILRWPMAAAITLLAAANSLLAAVQRWRYGQRIAAARLAEAPVFIIGHWRSGTTYLHELMVLDERFSYSNTYQCFVPHHFLVSEWWLKRLAWFLLPSKRPMDNMSAGWNLPQEDEFALVTLGAETPYLRMAFPNDPRDYLETLDMEGLDDAQLARFKDALRDFTRALAVRDPRRLILKSPPHTGRIGVLLELFPDARFIHITRQPYDLAPSTIRLWRSLDEVQGLQLPRNERLQEYVFAAFERMYHGFERDKHLVAPERFFEVRYEDLARDPVGLLADIYRHLDLGDFEPVRARVEENVAARRDYQKNRHELAPELKAEIDRRWGDYMRRYGYAADSVAAE